MINAKGSWQYSYTDMALVLYNIGDFSNDMIMPRLASPTINNELTNYCFSFDYRVENAQIMVRLNEGDAEGEQFLTSVTGNGRAFVVLPSGTLYRIMLEPNITQSNTDFFVELKRFKLFDQISCGKAKYEYRTRSSQLIVQGWNKQSCLEDSPLYFSKWDCDNAEIKLLYYSTT